MLSQTKYKIIYATYCFGISLLLFGVLYMNFARLRSSQLAGLGLDKVQNRNLMEIGIFSAVVIVVCLFVIIYQRFWLSPWKCIYGMISAAIIFMIEFVMIVWFHELPYGRGSFVQLLAYICPLGLWFVTAGLIVLGFLLNWLSHINVLLDEDGEVVSAILISTIAVMLVTIVSYTLLC